MSGPDIAVPVRTPPLTRVPAGAFWMGADVEDDKFASVVELPRHHVTLARPFQMGRYPVTFADWDAYCDAHPAAHRPDDHSNGRGDLPVTNVSAADIDGYLAWLSHATGHPFRLPSEAEWEYACRAGAVGAFTTGDQIDVSQANFLYLDFGDRPGLGRPTPVGRYRPNAFGLYDVHGNVAEIVADDWHDDYTGAPVNGGVWKCASPSSLRVVRNGGWDGLPRILRAAFRDWIGVDHRHDNVGFRVACDCP